MSNVLRGTLVNPEKIYGKSAYEIAVMHGFDGTEKEWLESLGQYEENAKTQADRAEKAADEAEAIKTGLKNGTITAAKANLLAGYGFEGWDKGSVTVGYSYDFNYDEEAVAYEVTGKYDVSHIGFRSQGYGVYIIVIVENSDSSESFNEYSKIYRTYLFVLNECSDMYCCDGNSSDSFGSHLYRYGYDSYYWAGDYYIGEYVAEGDVDSPTGYFDGEVIEIRNEKDENITADIFGNWYEEYSRVVYSKKIADF